jgi:hypothetical protein
LENLVKNLRKNGEEDEEDENEIESLESESFQSAKSFNDDESIKETFN